jgi:hypothetical protein
MRLAQVALIKPVELSKTLKLVLVGKLEKLVMFRRIALDTNKSH